MRPPSPLHVERRLFDALATRSAAERDRFAHDATLAARQRGLVVIRESGDVDIPMALSPVVMEDEQLAQMGRDAAAVLHGIVATSRAVLSQGLGTPLAQELFGHLGEVEWEALGHFADSEDVTIARVDWFLDPEGAHHALELNSTIPAMQAYSDAAAAAWLEIASRGRGGAGPGAEALLSNGSNVDDLIASLLAHAAQPSARNVAIIHRAGDPQLRELEAIARELTRRGLEVWLVTPDEVQMTGAQGLVLSNGAVPDVVYRHIFARRIPLGSALARLAGGGSVPALQNPVNGHLEVKGVLAELSRRLAEASDDLALDEADRAILSRVLPWTRLLGRGPGLSPDGTRFDDLPAWVSGHPDELVLKKSWDYGGKSVVLGRDVAEAEGIQAWSRRVELALDDPPGAWVVQKRIEATRRRLFVAVDGTRASEEEVFVDVSTFTASGTTSVPTGGVVRWARSGVVNIVGGGGVAPLLRASVARTWLDGAT